jgi:hypothetical protein
MKLSINDVKSLMFVERAEAYLLLCEVGTKSFLFVQCVELSLGSSCLNMKSAYNPMYGLLLC